MFLICSIVYLSSVGLSPRSCEWLSLMKSRLAEFTSFTTHHTMIRIANTAVVCQEATLSGDITIGEGTIIQPKASIIAEAGPIIIGPDNIVEELVVIKNRYRICDEMILNSHQSFAANVPEEDKKISRIMKIGANNIFEVGAG